MKFAKGLYTKTFRVRMEDKKRGVLVVKKTHPKSFVDYSNRFICLVGGYYRESGGLPPRWRQ